jgi:hypothetical protein
MFGRSQTPPPPWELIDVRLRTDLRGEDYLHHLGLLVVEPIVETKFGSARESCPGIDRFGCPALNARWTDTSVCVLEGTISAVGQA